MLGKKVAVLNQKAAVMMGAFQDLLIPLERYLTCWAKQCDTESQSQGFASSQLGRYLEHYFANVFHVLSLGAGGGGSVRMLHTSWDC